MRVLAYNAAISQSLRQILGEMKRICYKESIDDEIKNSFQEIKGRPLLSKGKSKPPTPNLPTIATLAVHNG